MCIDIYIHTYIYLDYNLSLWYSARCFRRAWYIWRLDKSIGHNFSVTLSFTLWWSRERGTQNKIWRSHRKLSLFRGKPLVSVSVPQVTRLNQRIFTTLFTTLKVRSLDINQLKSTSRRDISQDIVFLLKGHLQILIFSRRLKREFTNWYLMTCQLRSWNGSEL